MKLDVKKYYRLLCAVTAALLLVTTGCAPFKTDEPSVGKPVSNYLATLERWTRSERVTEDMETRLTLSATYKSIQFRVAYIDEYAERFLIDTDRKKSMLVAEARAVKTHNVFFISAYTPVDKWNDFDETDSSWKLYLEDDSGRRVSPVEIRKEDAGDPTLRGFFPYIDYWSNVYTVIFPTFDERGVPIGGDDVSGLKLIITGVNGRTELVWK